MSSININHLTPSMHKKGYAYIIKHASFSCRFVLVFVTFLCNQLLKSLIFILVWLNELFRKISVRIPTGIYLLRVNNRNTEAKCEICSKLTRKTEKDDIGVVLVSVLLTLNIFHVMF